MKKLIMAALLLLMAFVSFADEVIIGSGSNTGGYPFYAYSGYSRSASLITSAEATRFGVIQQLAWNVNTAQFYTNCPIKIYLKQSSASSLSAASWATMTAGATLVYNGSFRFYNTGWMLIDISDFNYTANNLMVLCETNYGGTGTSEYPKFTFSTINNMHASIYSDNVAPTGNLSVNAYRPNIALIFPATNIPASSELVSPANSEINVLETATLNWKSSFKASGYKLYFGTNYPPTNIVNGTNLGNVLSFDPTGYLSYSQTYYWQIVPTNTIGDAVGSPTWSFTTRANPTITSFPKLWDFNGSFPPTNWTTHRGVLASPTLLGAKGTGSWQSDSWLNFSTPNQSAARINLYSSLNGWLISPPISAPSDNYEVKMDIAFMQYDSDNPPATTGTDDKFIVLIGDGNSWTPANIARQWDNAGSIDVLNNIHNAGQSVTVPLGAAGTKYIAFYGISTVSNADNDLMLDNIEIRQQTISFGDVALNRSSEWTNVAVTNTVSSTITVSQSNVSIIGADPSQFEFSSVNLPVTLSSGQSVNIPVRYNAISSGVKSATLRVAYNNSNHDVLLNGCGMTPGVMPIGNGSTYQRLPIHAPYGFSYSQSLFLQPEINLAGKRVEKLKYYWCGYSAGTNSNDWVIYMGHTTKTFFATTADWIPLTALTQVFNGSVTLPATAGWIEIALDTPFVYNNTDNLVIAIDENEAGYDTARNSFYSTPTNGNRSILYYSDSENINPATPLTATSLVRGVPNIRLHMGDSSLIEVSDSTQVNFGTVYLGDDESVVRQLGSVGSTPVTITNIVFSNPNSAFSIEGLSLPLSLAPGAVLDFSLVFTPTQARAYNDVLNIVNSSQNYPIISIPIIGVGEYVPPQAPQDVTLTIDGNDMLLNWDPVTQSIYNSPIAVPYYFIYGSVVPNPDNTQQIFLGYSNGTSFRHLGVGLPGSNVQAPRAYYYTITAVIWYPTRNELLDLDQLIGLDKEEVSKWLGFSPFYSEKHLMELK